MFRTKYDLGEPYSYLEKIYRYDSILLMQAVKESRPARLNAQISLLSRKTTLRSVIDEAYCTLRSELYHK